MLLKGKITLKKKVFGIVLAIVLIFAMLSFVIFGILRCEVFIDESPNGDYQIVSWWIGKGVCGYRGSFYVKEKGLFSKWYKLGTEVFAGKWISETLFAVHHAYVVDEDNYKEYNVNEFFNK